MKSTILRLTLALILLSTFAIRAADPPAAATAAPPQQPQAQRDKTPSDRLREYVASLRSELSDGKAHTINQVMDLSVDEAKTFWPIYHDYEEELFANGDKRLDLIKQYVKLHSTKALTNDKARELSAAWFDFQQQQLDLLKKYHAQIQQEVSPIRAAQFVQIEHRFGLVVDLMIASELPLVETVDAKAAASGAPAAAEPKATGSAVPAGATIQGK
jgi:hypothetical protein